jgi:natural product precursor
MVRQNTPKKLALKKQTIAHLESQHMMDVKGGYTARIEIISYNDTCLCNSRNLCSEENCDPTVIGVG